MASEWRRRGFRHFANVWAPFLAAGVHVTRVEPGFAAIDVELRMRPWNRNYVGTHFGGSLFAMADPFFMIMLIEQLGPRYVVWDKSAAIRFRKPGRGTVRARFEIPPERLDAIRAAVDRDGRTEATFAVEIRDAEGDVVAEVDKVISVRRKDAPRGATR